MSLDDPAERRKERLAVEVVEIQLAAVVSLRVDVLETRRHLAWKSAHRANVGLGPAVNRRVRQIGAFPSAFLYGTRFR